ncbi:MAG: hypothetical protein JWN23_1523 [Rhodocyclales bacterium]|nr:hypothetical protein [Rhodocyclales bacterium]
MPTFDQLPSTPRHSAPSHGTAGFTLIELMVTLAIIAILVALAAPAMNDLLQNNRIAATASAFGSAVNIARAEAVRRSTTVTLCASNDLTTPTCAGSWTDGWLAFVDGGAVGTFNAGDTKVKVWQTPVPTNTTIGAGGFTYIAFNSRGAVTNGAGPYTFCIGGTGGKLRTINLQATGRMDIKPGVCP